MHDITASNLRNAHGGESMAHMRYRIWSKKAELEGLPNIARLFAAIAHAEDVHAANHFGVLKDSPGPFVANSASIFGLDGTAQNLVGAIEGETFEINEMYPTYLETARFQGEESAGRSFHYALSAEKIHAEMFKKAKEVADSGKDLELGPVYICPVCGWTHEGEPPDFCPICGAKRETFRVFE